MTTDIIPRWIVVFLCVHMGLSIVDGLSDTDAAWWWWLSVASAVWYAVVAVLLVVEGIRQWRRT